VKLNILLVDDNVIFRDSVREILELYNYNVVEADNGRAALKVLMSTNPVDLVITDILMPEIEGIELAYETKKIRSELKVIGMTGGGRIGNADEVRGICAKFLFEDVIKKPFQSKELLATIEEVLA